MPSGIYVIRNEVSGKMYVGSAVDIAKRLAKHRYQLRSGVHPSKHLQASFNKYGDAAFETATLEVCEDHQLVEREQHWINVLKPAYNKRLIAESNVGLTTSPEQRAAAREIGRRPETVSRLSAAVKASWADPARKAARIKGLREAWTPEKRQLVSELQRGVDKGEAAREARWSDPEQRKRASETMRARHAASPVHTVDSIRAAIEANPNWRCVEITGHAMKDTATVRCEKHDREQTVTVRKALHAGSGCRLCGFERSSEKQMGRPKGLTLKVSGEGR